MQLWWLCSSGLTKSQHLMARHGPRGDVEGVSCLPGSCWWWINSSSLSNEDLMSHGVWHENGKLLLQGMVCCWRPYDWGTCNYNLCEYELPWLLQLWMVLKWRPLILRMHTSLLQSTKRSGVLLDLSLDLMLESPPFLLYALSMDWNLLALPFAIIWLTACSTWAGNLVWLTKTYGYDLRPNLKMATNTMPMPFYMLMTF